MLNNIKRIANCSRISEIPDYYTSVDFEPWKLMVNIG
jgi:hypothetical protein